MGLKMCKVTVGSREKAYPDGTPFGEIVKDFDQDCKYPVVLVTVDGKLRELHKKIHSFPLSVSSRCPTVSVIKHTKEV